MKEIIEQIRLKVDACGDATIAQRSRKGAYVDCLVMIKEAHKNIEYPTDAEIFIWLKEQKYQTEMGTQEYRMYFDVDMPKIIRAAIANFSNQTLDKL